MILTSATKMSNPASKCVFIKKVQKKKRVYLCKGTDCSKKKTDVFTNKCAICDGYFADDGLNDIFYVEEKPNRPTGACHLCGNLDGIVQMKGTGEFICEGACDEDDEETRAYQVWFSSCDGEERNTDIFHVPSDIPDEEDIIIEYLEDLECCSIDEIERRYDY